VYQTEGLPRHSGNEASKLVQDGIMRVLLDGREFGRERVLAALAPTYGRKPSSFK
jgi:hypothetical protein